MFTLSLFPTTFPSLSSSSSLPFHTFPFLSIFLFKKEENVHPLSLSYNLSLSLFPHPSLPYFPLPCYLMKPNLSEKMFTLSLFPITFPSLSSSSSLTFHTFPFLSIFLFKKEKMFTLSLFFIQPFPLSSSSSLPFHTFPFLSIFLFKKEKMFTLSLFHTTFPSLSSSSSLPFHTFPFLVKIPHLSLSSLSSSFFSFHSFPTLLSHQICLSIGLSIYISLYPIYFIFGRNFPMAPNVTEEETFQCSKCDQFLDLISKTLSCLHSFCGSCVEMILGGNGQCPQCQQPVTGDELRLAPFLRPQEVATDAQLRRLVRQGEGRCHSGHHDGRLSPALPIQGRLLRVVQRVPVRRMLQGSHDRIPAMSASSVDGEGGDVKREEARLHPGSGTPLEIHIRATNE
ncbi:unnamed protein product [Acanthosepion pharaonis]|uniref:RING-type domain-containing protein n=1 Tax=Acanthosepion pharaonis TaxID=158019 RepID=A0A812CC23_ACAPH|nr:unnamed protein product [Sepia pharaonis]